MSKVPNPGRNKTIAGLVGVLLSLWLGLAGWITYAGNQVQLHKVDCIIVLGARSLPDGQPGPSLRARCDRGVQLWREGWAPYILCTGGRGQSGTVEGVVARNYIQSQGVPPERIVYEGLSHTTRQNFFYAQKVMEARGWQSCLVVSDPFHLPRSLSIARGLNLEAYPAPGFEGPGWKSWGSWTFYTVRETLAWMKHLLT